METTSFMTSGATTISRVTAMNTTTRTSAGTTQDDDVCQGALAASVLLTSLSRTSSLLKTLKSVSEPVFFINGINNFSKETLENASARKNKKVDVGTKADGHPLAS